MVTPVGRGGGSTCFSLGVAKASVPLSVEREIENDKIVRSLR